MFDVIFEECSIFEAVVPTSCRGVSVVPTTQDLSGASVSLVNEKDRAMKLRNALIPAKEFYDYIFIDCPPTLDMLTINALAAADSVLIPLQCEFLSLEGLVELHNTINRVKVSFNPDLDIEGILFTMCVERYKITGQIISEVKNTLQRKSLKLPYRETLLCRKPQALVSRLFIMIRRQKAQRHMKILQKK